MTNSPATDTTRAAQQAAASQQQVLDDKENEGLRILEEENMEEKESRQKPTRSGRRKTGSFDPKGDSLKGLRDRVTGSLHGRSHAILHADGVH